MKSVSAQTSPEGYVASVNGIQMYYEVYGEGTPLVLLHAFTSSGQRWQPFIADLAKQYRLIIPDLRGHGRSTNPMNQFTHRQSALDIFALLDQLEINQFKAMGISSGGMTLVHMATQQPARVEAMVLIGTTIYFTDQARAFFRETTPEGKGWDWELLRQHHVHGDDQIQALLTQLHNFKDNYDDMNFTAPYLSTITAKTLVVHGDRDELFPISIPVEMYTSIPHAYLWIIPNGEHAFILDKHAAVFTQTALEFLRGDWAMI
jgi:pimeloyl-ACP methyl ester carboxylesterase